MSISVTFFTAALALLEINRIFRPERAVRTLAK